MELILFALLLIGYRVAKALRDAAAKVNRILREERDRTERGAP